MKHVRLILLAVLMMSILPITARADVIAQWTPTAPAEGQSNASDQPQKVKSKAEHVDVSDLTHSSDDTSSNTTAVWPNKAVPKFDDKTYATFSLAPQDKTSVSVSKIDFDFTSYNDADNDKGYTLTLRSSEDNFATDVATVTVKHSADGTFELDLSKLKPITRMTTFRLYFVDNSGGEDSWADLSVGEHEGLRIEGKVEAAN